GISNLLTIYSLLSKQSISSLEEKYAGKMYGDFKKDLADLVCDYLLPVQKKYHDFLKNPDYLQKILSQGKTRAQTQAQKTLDTVYKKIGLLPLKDQ
ncbi:MAG: hypothetical protein OXB84_04435, partial [Halobacteriovoraceae bacterium]|nr:hypothetical protein [Halobacteriovoraceae bacterium]